MMRLLQRDEALQMPEVRMRDLAFYQQVDHLQKDCRGRPLYLPVFYYDVTAVFAGFLTPIDKVQAILPSPRMKPLRATPWHAVTVIACFEYRDCDAGPYNEVGITFPFTMDRPAPVLTGLLRHIAEGPMAFVYKLPVNTELARDFGIDFYNYPKFMANIDFSNESGWLKCRLAEGGKHILTLAARQLPTRPWPRWYFDGITVRDGRILRSEVAVNVREQALSRNPADVKLELGDHDLARELRGLNLGRMVHLQYVPRCQTILSGVVESWDMKATS
jgi:hypothetical protein